MNDVLAVGFPSCRLVLSFMGFFGMINCYTLRVNLSVAIVMMVNSTYLAELEASARDENDTTGHSVCPVNGEEADVIDIMGMGNLTNMTNFTTPTPTSAEESVRMIICLLCITPSNSS